MLTRSPRAAVVLAAGLVCLAAASPAAAWPGLNGRIGLTQRPTNKDLWAFPRDGTATKLTFTSNNEEQMSWAPDGKRIVFKRSDEVFVRDVTTEAAPVRLTNKVVSTENNTQAAWSPDGASIVFRTNRATPTVNVADIWIMDADGNNERPLIVQPGDQRYPSISPDGTRIAYTSAEEGGTADLWLANADGTDPHRIYDSGREDSAPAWSPDGTRLAFEVHGPVGGVDGDIFVLALASGEVTQMTRDPADAPVHDEGPAWSPDGRMLAFTSERADPNGDVWVMQADGSDPQRLTDNAILDESPDWQPIPFSVGKEGHPSVACGDLSPAAGGVSSIAAVKVPCDTARRVASQWSAEQPRVEGFACTQTPHSFDQDLVECEHRGGWKGIAFVARHPEG
jgi:Tol biopolymer transport system component